MKYFIYRAEIAGQQKYVLSLLPKEHAFKNGLKDQAVVGYLKSEKLDYKEFTENTAFKELLQRIIAEELPKNTDFLKEGKRIGTGYVYVLDKRTQKPKGDVPIEDFIGAIEFTDGNIVAGSFLPNTNYKLLTKDGIFNLPFSQEESLLLFLQNQ